MTMEQMIREGLLEMGLSPEAAPALAEYGRLLLEKNQVMNLTALREPEQVARLHFLDSAGLFGAADLAGKKVIDIGSGGGFPGLPLRLIEPSIQLTLLDALGKRVTWLSEVTQALGTADVTCIHARAEEQALLPDYREQSARKLNYRNPPFITVVVDLSAPAYLHIHIGGQCIDNRGTYSVKPSAGLIRRVIKLSSGMQRRIHNPLRGYALCMKIYRHAAPVIRDCRRSVFLQSNPYLTAEARQMLIHRIIYNLINQMVQPLR